MNAETEDAFFQALTRLIDAGTSILVSKFGAARAEPTAAATEAPKPAAPAKKSPPAPKPAAAAAPAAAPAPAATATVPVAAATNGPTPAEPLMAQCRNAAKSYAEVYGREGLKEVLSKFTTGTMADIEAAKLPELLKALS